MTGFTVPLGFPYPQPADPLDGPAQLQALAEAIDDSMVSTLASLQGATAPPCAKVTGTSQNAVSGAGTLMNFNSVYFDNDGMADLVADPQKLTVRTAGVYAVYAFATFAPNATAYREVNIRRNGAVLSRWSSNAVNSTLVSLGVGVSGLVSMSVGDNFDMFTVQVSGVTLPTLDCQLTAFRVSS